MIYLNAAGHGLPDRRVRARMRAYMEREDEVGPIAAESEVADELAAVRVKAAALIGASVYEIALPAWTSGGWNAAVLSLPLAGKRVLAAPGEWSSNVALLRRMGADVQVMPTDADGVLDLTALAARLDESVAAICAPMVCSLTGERYPVEAIGALTRPEGCFYVIDAAQALGQMPVSVTALNCDILVAPTRKWVRGPRGTALLFVRQSALARMGPSLVSDYGGVHFAAGRFTDRRDAQRFEPMGVFAPQRLGLGVALDRLAEPDGVFRIIRDRAGAARGRAMAAGFTLAGAEPQHSAIVTLNGPREQIVQMAENCAAADIFVKLAGPDCEPLRPPEVMQDGFLRISPHVYNTDAEIDRLFEVLAA